GCGGVGGGGGAPLGGQRLGYPPRRPPPEALWEPPRAPPAAPASSWRESLAVYLQPRVLIVLFLGFSSGLPLALSGSTLLVWMRESGVDLGTIGLFALVGTPYTLKFLWAPL